MMLAQRKHLNVLDDDHLVVVFMENSVVQQSFKGRSYNRHRQSGQRVRSVDTMTFQMKVAPLVDLWCKFISFLTHF